MNSSPVFAKLRAWEKSKAALAVTCPVPSVPGSLLIFSEDGPDDPVTISLELEIERLILRSGDLRLMFFLSTATAFEIRPAVSDKPETVVIGFPDFKLSLSER